ncbi:hypothetical protein UFOVP286_76 [uncultured Caudovirales phage]|uniref:Uncharacterized protein n=1 Tax=uncultured Caudovirales phage TaxID=2100421 RepID=A0A6J5LRY1_9CAUD|nr:hypothetical protein UFOVP286_76 [uncultured Caudovirales phage]
MIKALGKFITKTTQNKENLELKQIINRLAFIKTKRSYNSYKRGNCFKSKKQEISTAGKEFKMIFNLDNIIYLDCRSEDYKHMFSYASNHIDNLFSYDSDEPVLIFLKNGTKEAIKKANELAGTLNSHHITLFILDCYVYNFATNEKFLDELQVKFVECLRAELNYKLIPESRLKSFEDRHPRLHIPSIAIELQNIDQLFSTNSTGILEPQENSHFTVFDCEKVFKIKNFITTNPIY